MKKELSILFAGIAIGSIVTILASKNPQHEAVDIDQTESAASTASVATNPEKSKETASLREEVANLREKLSSYEAKESANQSELDAKKAKYIRFALQRYEALFDLSTQQKELIGELEWDSKVFWDDARGGKIDMSKAELPKMEENVSLLLTEHQNKIYQDHLDSQKDSSTELASTAFLSQIPVTLNLSDEQKDEVYKNLYVSLHPNTQAEFQKRWDSSQDHEFDKTRQMIVWAAEETLTHDQLEKLKQAYKK
jgi:hypothetical protein